MQSKIHVNSMQCPTCPNCAALMIKKERLLIKKGMLEREYEELMLKFHVLENEGRTTDEDENQTTVNPPAASFSLLRLEPDRCQDTGAGGFAV